MDGLGWGFRVSSCRFTWFGRVGGVILGGFLEVKTGLDGGTDGEGGVGCRID